MAKILTKMLATFASGGDAPAAELPEFFDHLLAADDEELLARLLTAWKYKGFGEEELFGLASIMRERCLTVASPYERFVDAVGTGGSKTKTFNVSTAAAFVVAGTGVAVAKHGNRAATSSSGSADVLAELRVEPAVSREKAEACLAKIGICFMFAPNFHRLSPVLAKVRRGLGFPTIFNLLGPLCNPASAPHQLIGVWDESLVELTARVLARLGTQRSWVVHGLDGLDEITLDGPTLIADVTKGNVQTRLIRPGDLGLEEASLSELRTSSPGASADLVRRVLMGEAAGETAERLVLINAAAAIHLATEESLEVSVESARTSLASGAANRKLTDLITLTNS